SRLADEEAAAIIEGDEHRIGHESRLHSGYNLEAFRKLDRFESLSSFRMQRLHGLAEESGPLPIRKILALRLLRRGLRLPVEPGAAAGDNCEAEHCGKYERLGAIPIRHDSS